MHAPPTPALPADRDALALAAHAERIAAVVAEARRWRLLSTLPFNKVAFWREAVTTLPFDERPTGWRGWLARRGLLDPGRIGRLLRLAPRHDVVLLNGGERIDLIYLALAACLPWIRTPHVIIDAHWHVDPRPWRQALQRLVLRAGRRLLAEVQPHSDEEIPIYERHFGLPRAVVRPLPWSTSLTGYGHVVRRVDPGDAIVCGGHSYRDYPTLFAAVRGMPWTVRVGLPPAPGTEAIVAAAADLPQVRIVPDWRYADYWQQVADSRVFAMPITPGLTRCTADQTLLNAMALGAVVVATDALSSRLYIRHGVNGFLVPEADPDAWRRTLDHVWNLSDADRARIRAAAQADALGPRSEVRRLLDTLDRAHALARAARERGAGAPWARG